MHHKYLYRNYKLLPTFRKYNDFVPEYLHRCPQKVIIHYLDRRNISQKFYGDVLTRHMTSGLFTLQSSSKTHTIDFGFTSGKPSSTCADWVRWKFGKYVPCKHIFATFRLVDGWGWASLPDVYKHSPYLSDDSSAMLEYSGSCVPNSAFLIVVLETIVLMKL